MKRLPLLLLFACASTPPPVSLAGNWPQAAGRYDEAYERWTRRGKDEVDLVQTVAVSATLLAPEFRAAYARERAVRLGLSADEEAQLVAAERSASDEGWEVELLVATSFPVLNDLKKQDKKGSLWHIALISDDGRQVTPTSVKLDKRQRDDVARYFPDLEPFYLPYRITFPRASADGRPLVGPEAKRLSLEIASALGKVVLVWATTQP